MRIPRDENKLLKDFRRALLSHSAIPYKTFSGDFIPHDAVRILITCIYDLDDSFYYGQECRTHHLDAYLASEGSKRPMNHTEMYHAAIFLQKVGLVEYVCGSIDDFSFSATYECMHFFQIKRKQFLHRLFNSIFLPIVVSVITALLVVRFSG